MSDGKRSWTNGAGLLLAAVLMTTAGGCSDEPTALNSVGTQLLRTRVTVKDTTLLATGSSTFRQPVATGGNINLLGRSGNYVAYALLQFTPALLPHRDTVNVLSAEFSFRAVTWFGDSLSTFGFTVHKITEGWNEGTFQWDSLSLKPNFYETASRGDTTVVVQGDTQTVSVRLDTGLVREWLQPRTITQYGIILIPTPGTNVIRGMNPFYFNLEEDSTKYYPTLRVIAQGFSASAPDTSTYIFGFDTFVGNVTSLTTDPELLYLQAGIAYRSRIHFDLTSVPKGAIINEAQLLLVENPAANRLTKFSGEKVVAGHLLASATDTTRFESFGELGKISSANTYTLRIRHAVQEWVRGASNNHGLLLRNISTNEFSSFDLYTFYNHAAADTTKRPRLKVVYTIEKN
jgi:hypothetical protein